MADSGDRCRWCSYDPQPEGRLCPATRLTSTPRECQSWREALDLAERSAEFAALAGRTAMDLSIALRRDVLRALGPGTVGEMLQRAQALVERLEAEDWARPRG